MIFGHILTKETEAAYAAPIREAIRYCRETDVSGFGESRFELRGEEFIELICDRVTEAYVQTGMDLQITNNLNTIFIRNKQKDYGYFV